MCTETEREQHIDKMRVFGFGINHETLFLITNPIDGLTNPTIKYNQFDNHDISKPDKTKIKRNEKQHPNGAGNDCAGYFGFDH